MSNGFATTLLYVLGFVWVGSHRLNERPPLMFAASAFVRAIVLVINAVVFRSEQFFTLAAVNHMLLTTTTAMVMVFSLSEA